MKLRVAVLALALSGCALLQGKDVVGGPRHQAGNACAFCLFLPEPGGIMCMAACTYGVDIVLGVDGDEPRVKTKTKTKGKLPKAEKTAPKPMPATTPQDEECEEDDEDPECQ